MYNKASLIKDLKAQGIFKGISKEYGRDSVIELKGEADSGYMFYIAESNIENCFFNTTRSVIDKLIANNQDFALIFMDVLKERLYVYDKCRTLKLLSTVSCERKYGNYKIVESDLENPIDYISFCEFIDSLR